MGHETSQWRRDAMGIPLLPKATEPALNTIKSNVLPVAEIRKPLVQKTSRVARS